MSIPERETEFYGYQRQFTQYVAANDSALNVDSDEVTNLQNESSNYEASQDDLAAHENLTQGKRQRRDADHNTLEAHIRRLFQKFHADSNVTDEQIEAMGGTPHKTTRTPTPDIESRPIGHVDHSQRLRHTLSWVDESTPDSRARHKHSRGCQIWFKIGGDAPIDPELECTYKATDSASPFTMIFEGQHASKVVYYCFRWESKNGNPGPWSETVAATIVG